MSGRKHRKAPVKTSRREEAEIESLKKRIEEVTPERGSLDTSSVRFADLPISHYLISELEKNGFTKLTEIQRAAIPHALAGRDVLGAAKTGSGKTLAFLVPLLERLYRSRRVAGDGLGALVVTPTRELALQIMDVVRKVSKQFGMLAAGCVTGGTDFSTERRLIGQLSVLVGTPGRLVQHLEQSPDLDLSTLEVLVMDEADRLLDMGFRDQVDVILRAVPSERQTLLFSATQPRSVRDLARLSLVEPEYVSAHVEAMEVTPRRLVQAYVECEIGDKVNLLWSFVRSHLRCKTMVFVSTTKQARFLYELLRRLRPGVSVLELHGKIKQAKRVAVYKDFMKQPAAVLIATDIAARGLDFTGVHWVLQLDCPDDAETYIHRVGRTARNHHSGNGLLVLTPSESRGILPQLEHARVPLKKTSISSSKAVNIHGKVASEIAADPRLRYLAQRAVLSYVRSIVTQPNTEVFQPSSLDLEAISKSYGLASVPKSKALRRMGLALPTTESALVTNDDEDEETIDRDLKSLQRTRAEAKQHKNRSGALAQLQDEIRQERLRNKLKSATAKKTTISSDDSSLSSGDSSSSSSSSSSEEEEEEEDDFLKEKPKKSIHLEEEEQDTSELLSAEQLRKLPEWDRVKAANITQAVEALRDESSAPQRGFAAVAAELAGSSDDEESDVEAAVQRRTQLLQKKLEKADQRDKIRERQRIRKQRLIQKYGDEENIPEKIGAKRPRQQKTPTPAPKRPKQVLPDLPSSDDEQE